MKLRAIFDALTGAALVALAAVAATHGWWLAVAVAVVANGAFWAVASVLVAVTKDLAGDVKELVELAEEKW